MRTPWTRRQDALLRKLYLKGLLLDEIAARIGVSKSAVRNRVHHSGLRRNFFRRPYTRLEKKKLRRLYPNMQTSKVARLLGRTVSSTYGYAKKLGLKKSEEYMASPSACRLRRGDNVGATFRFLPGHIPANKGLRRPGYAPGRMACTQFKKGQLNGAAARKFCPIGTVKLNPDGYLIRKISDIPNNGSGATNRNWEFVHRRVWEDARGPIPKGHRIWWKDGNHKNCALENLELLSDQEHMARTTIHNLPPELKNTIMWAGALKRRIRRRVREEQAQRST